MSDMYVDRKPSMDLEDIRETMIERLNSNQNFNSIEYFDNLLKFVELNHIYMLQHLKKYQLN